jgi:hypothetical protein
MEDEDLGTGEDRKIRQVKNSEASTKVKSAKENPGKASGRPVRQTQLLLEPNSAESLIMHD